MGLGPGDDCLLTAQEAQNAWNRRGAICGYTVYIDLVSSPVRNNMSTGMTREIDRCRWALEKAAPAGGVALVCSGDAGVYGMASPLLELAAGLPGRATWRSSPA